MKPLALLLSLTFVALLAAGAPGRNVSIPSRWNTSSTSTCEVRGPPRRQRT